MVATTKVTMIKTEDVYGTYSAPDAANAILTRNRRVRPIQVDQLERNLDLPTRGASPTLPTNERQTMDFEVEMVGSGDATKAARFMELLRHAGMGAPTIAAGVATQKFVGPDSEGASASLRHWIGDQERQMFGARATFSVDVTAGAYPFFSLSYTGLLPIDDEDAFGVSVPPAVDLSGFRQPLNVNTANTDFTLAGYAAVLRSLRLDVNAEISTETLVGAVGVTRGDHAVTGRIVCRAPSTATRNYLSNLRRGDLLPMILDHGVAVGDRTGLRSPNLQITEINETEQGGILEYEIGVRATVLAGSDDLIVTSG